MKRKSRVLRIAALPPISKEIHNWNGRVHWRETEARDTRSRPEDNVDTPCREASPLPSPRVLGA